jgi:ParB family transcriptional regulator, chromosome partitioning protein
MLKPNFGNVSLALIKESSEHHRGVHKQSEEYQALVNSIIDRGVMMPILVRPVGPNGEFEIIKGLHRYNAALDAGLKVIPTYTVQMTDEQVRECRLIASVHRIETKPVEYSRQLLRLIGTMNLPEICKRLRKSMKWVKDRLSLLKLTAPIGKLVNEGRMCLANAYVLAKLPCDEQGKYLDKALCMAPTDFTGIIACRKKELDQARRKGRKGDEKVVVDRPRTQSYGNQFVVSGVMGQ